VSDLGSLNAIRQWHVRTLLFCKGLSSIERGLSYNGKTRMESRKTGDATDKRVISTLMNLDDTKTREVMYV
jgi:hypothetical protein